MPGLGLGLGMPSMSPPLWDPIAELGADLLGWWNPRRVDKLTLSGTAVTAYADVVGGYAASQAITSAKPRWDASCFGGVLNLAQNWMSPAGVDTELTPVTDGSVIAPVAGTPLKRIAGNRTATRSARWLLGTTNVAAGVITARITFAADVSDSCGFGLYDQTASSWGLNANATATVVSGPGVITQTLGALFLITGLSPTAPTVVEIQRTYLTACSANLYVYPKDSGATPAAVGVQAGEVVFAQTASFPGYIPTSGAPAYGFGRPALIFDGADDELTLPSVPFPTGATACEIWALVDQQALPADTVARRIFAYGGETSNDNRHLTRDVTAGVNRAFVSAGDGTQRISRNTTVDLSGRHVARGIVSSSLICEVEGQASIPTGPFVGTTGAVRTRIGAATAATANTPWQGMIADILVTNPLSAAKAAQLLAYLKSQGGIA